MPPSRLIAVVMCVILTACVAPDASPLPTLRPASTLRPEATPRPKATATSSSVALSASANAKSYALTVANNDVFDWTNVKLEINSPGVFQTGYVLQVPRVAAGQSYTAPLAEFAKPDGARYNPVSTKLLQLDIACDTPRGRGYWSGDW